MVNKVSPFSILIPELADLLCHCHFVMSLCEPPETRWELVQVAVFSPVNVFVWTQMSMVLSKWISEWLSTLLDLVAVSSYFCFGAHSRHVQPRREASHSGTQGPFPCTLFSVHVFAGGDGVESGVLKPTLNGSRSRLPLHRTTWPAGLHAVACPLCCVRSHEWWERQWDDGMGGRIEMIWPVTMWRGKRDSHIWCVWVWVYTPESTAGKTRPTLWDWCWINRQLYN
jgi:hypothetical protein